MRRAWIVASTSSAFLLLLATSAWADEPKARVQGDLDRGLRALIVRAVGTSEKPPATPFDARQRAREAGEAAIAVLRSEGYYEYAVTPDIGDGDTPQALVQVTPGPRFMLTAPEVDWQGPPPDAASTGVALKALALTPGAPGRAADVLAAEGRVIASIRKRGYADAAAAPREVIVDHADRTVRPTFHIVAGALVRLGGLRVVTDGRTRPAWVASLAPWKPGAIYDPDKLAKLETRLRDASVYDSVSVALATPDKAVDGERPVIVSLNDRPRHTVELGGGYATSEGVGANAKWIQYNRLGRADTLTFTANIAQIQQKLDLELDLPDWRRPDQILKLGGGVTGDRTSAYDDIDAGVRADVVRQFTKTTFITVGAAADYADTTEKTAVNPNSLPVGQHLHLGILTGLGEFALDRSNDPLNPTRGWRIDLRVEPTLIGGDRTLTYLKAQAQATGYLALDADASTVLAARLHLGSIVGGDIPNVPDDRRFFAGGGGSVRGYNYQGVGPRLSDNTPEGGLGLFESSFEVRQHLVGPWGVVAFVDAGSLSLGQAPDFSNFSAGAGVGVRYNLGFGPIRADIATPLNPRKGDPSVQLYLSIGQSF